MLDLDDFTTFELADRTQLFTRAAQLDQRWPAAQHALATLARTIDLPNRTVSDEVPTVLLVLPPELAGIGQVLYPLLHRPDQLNLFLWPPAQRLPTTGTPTVLLSAVPVETLHFPLPQHTTMTLIDLSTQISAEHHPAQVFLLLWALLRQLVPNHSAVPLDPLLTVQSPVLATCTLLTPVAYNPAKQLALQLHERFSFFYGNQALVGIATDWQVRMLWYAETMSASASLQELTRVQVMARLPRYWFNIITFVQIKATTAILAAAPNEAALQTQLERLFAIRRLQTWHVTAPGDLPAVNALWHLLEFGEWLALYAAALYNVDPADRVPLQFLGN